MIDKDSIPYFSVLLTKKDMSIYPHFPVPTGYHLCNFEPGMEIEWIKLNIIYESFESFGQAIEYFQSAFSSMPDLLSKQIVFVKEDATNMAVGTACLWEGMHFGQPIQRIHFLAVHPFHRNKGIGKSMITALLDVYKAQGYRGGIYITSQTWNFMEINMLFSFGFIPYMGDKPSRWSSTTQQFEKNKPIAWKIIMDNIGGRLFKEPAAPAPLDNPL